MSDDWSLKEKHKLNYGYAEEDIEILRQKLIEDIKERISLIEDDAYTDDVEMEKDYDSFVIRRLINIVNKRFGKEIEPWN